MASHFYALRTLLTESELVRFQVSNKNIFENILPHINVIKTMDVVRKADDTLDFQFKLVDGIIDMSYASLTALKMGVPRDVVDRAEEVNPLGFYPTEKCYLLFYT